MSDVLLTLDSDIKRVEANNAKLTKQLAGLKEELRNVKAASKEMTDTWANGLQKVQQLYDQTGPKLSRNIALSVKEIQALPKVVKQGETAWQRFGGVASTALTSSVAHMGGLAAGLVTVTSMVGVVSNAYAKWQQQIQDVGHTHRETSRTLVQELAEANLIAQAPEIENRLATMGGTAAQQSAVFGAVNKADPTATLERKFELTGEALKFSPMEKDVGGFASLMATIGQLKPGAEAGDVADLVTSVRGAAGDKIGTITDDKHQRQIKAMIARGMTPERALARAVAAADANLPASELRRAKLPGAADLERQFANAQMTNEGARNLAMFGQSMGGAAALTEFSAAGFGGDPRAQAAAMEEAQRQRAVEFVEAGGRRQGMFSQMDAGITMSLEPLIYALTGHAASGRKKTRGEVIAEMGESHGQITPSEAATFKKQEELITKQIEALRKIEANTSQMAVKRMNVDRHTE